MALDHPRDALPPRYALGHYEILRVLGRGGFGVTYAARSLRKTGEMVAIKELFPSGLAVRGTGGEVIPVRDADRRDLQETIGMFCREAEIICRIRHPNLVRGIEFLQQNHTGYLVMAYVSGKNLQEHLRSPRGDYRITHASVAQLCRGVLSALETLHAQGICHCDIKPDNIFLGIGFEPILIDLGSACLPVQADGTGVSTYSRHYSAIEQIDPRFGPVGPWTDIYQFAAVLYRCLAGGKLPDAVDRAAARFDPCLPLVDVEGVSQRFPPGFLDAIDSGLRLQPGARARSVREWRQRLDPFLEQMAGGDPGRPDAVDPRAKKPSPARPAEPTPVAAPSVAPIETGHRQESGRSVESPGPPVVDGFDPLKAIGILLVLLLGILTLLILGKGCSE